MDVIFVSFGRQKKSLSLKTSDGVYVPDLELIIDTLESILQAVKILVARLLYCF